MSRHVWLWIKSVGLAPNFTVYINFTHNPFILLLQAPVLVGCFWMQNVSFVGQTKRCATNISCHLHQLHTDTHTLTLSHSLQQTSVNRLSSTLRVPQLPLPFHLWIASNWQSWSFRYCNPILFPQKSGEVIVFDKRRFVIFENRKQLSRLQQWS